MHRRPVTAGAAGAPPVRNGLSRTLPVNREANAKPTRAMSRQGARRKSNTVIVSHTEPISFDAPIQGILGRSQGVNARRTRTAQAAPSGRSRYGQQQQQQQQAGGAAGLPSRGRAKTPAASRSRYGQQHQQHQQQYLQGGGDGDQLPSAGRSVPISPLLQREEQQQQQQQAPQRFAPSPFSKRRGQLPSLSGRAGDRSLLRSAAGSDSPASGSPSTSSSGYGRPGTSPAGSPMDSGNPDAYSAFGVSSVKGRRPYMEDEFTVIDCMEETCAAALAQGGRPRPAGRPAMGGTAFFGVFDGHAGRRCSRAVSRTVANNVFADPAFGSDLVTAVVNGFRNTEDAFIETARRYNMQDGTTAVTTFLRGSSLLVANVGDSRVVLSSRGTAVALSTDHKPNCPSERKRIAALGGRVVQCFGVARVQGVLAVSRAFGDAALKPYVSAEPELTRHQLQQGDDFLILASDGLWDVIGNQEAVDVVKRFADQAGLHATAKKLVDRALRKGSMDNTTALIIDLRFYMQRLKSATAAAAGPGPAPSALSPGAGAGVPHDHQLGVLQQQEQQQQQQQQEEGEEDGAGGAGGFRAAPRLVPSASAPALTGAAAAEGAAGGEGVPVEGGAASSGGWGPSWVKFQQPRFVRRRFGQQ